MDSRIEHVDDPSGPDALLRQPDDTLLMPAPVVSTVDGTVTVRQWLTGQPSIDVQGMVTRFYDRVLDDAAVAGYFDGVEIGVLREHFVATLLLITGSGVTVGTARYLYEAHRKVKTSDGDPITSAAFDAIIANLATVLSDAGVPRGAIEALRNVVQPLRPLLATPDGDRR